MIRLVVKIIKFFQRSICTWIVKLEVKSVGKNLIVNGYSKVTKSTELGNNVNLNGMSIDGQGKVKIGNNFHSGKHCRIITSFHDYDHGDCIPYDSNRVILKEVVIEDNVWLGYGVIILGGVIVGEGSIVQAGSVVVNDVPAFAVVGGHPAKQFKTRNVYHYNELKNKEMFF